ncbi:MAG TPA: hypothetical protein VFU46_09650 [Gemmatimonadales bacterium]|nr:hypothetical protein [Gemmatimonadales bacterium]
MHVTRIAAAAALVLAGARAAHAQDPDLAARLEPSARTPVQTLVDSARAGGLPARPLVAKALEGTAKRASGERIVAAVHALLRDLRTARSALGPSATESEITIGAAAVRAGVDPETLRGLRAVRADLTVPLAVLADLVGRGVPADTAAAAILQLAQRGAPDADFTGLARHVVQDVAAGIPPGVAAAARAGTPAPITRPAPPPGRSRPATPPRPRP